METTDQHKHTSNSRAWPGQRFAPLLGAQQAQADDASTGIPVDDRERVIEELVATAQKRKESLKTRPASIKATSL